MTSPAPLASPPRSPYRLTGRKFALALFSGLLIYLSFPPADLGPLVWVGLVPLFLALTQVRALGGLVLGLVYGLTFFVPFSHFMVNYGTVPWLVTAVFQGCFFALFGLLATAGNGCRHPALRAFPMAAAYTLCAEVLRGSVGSLGFTNGDLGYTQHSQLPILQMASMVGHYGLGFAICALNALLAQTLLAVAPGILLRPALDPRVFARLAAKTALAAYVVLILLYVWGALVMRAEGHEASPPFSVAAVQASLVSTRPATEEDVQQSIAAYLALSRTIPDEVRLIVWPETAVPVRLNRRPDLMQQLSDFAAEKRVWLLAGAARAGDADQTYNSLFLFAPTGALVDTYSKVHLVPFGEYVPQREKYPFLERFPVRKFDFSPGEGYKVLDVDGVKIGPIICFEALFPHVLRQVTRMGAEVIVAATSDEWARGTPEIAQHSYTAPVRAVESRRYIVRAGTWGISGIITPYGTYLSPVPVGAAGVAWEDVHPRRDLSPYHRAGDLPLLLLCAALWLAGFVGTHRPRPQPH